MSESRAKRIVVGLTGGIAAYKSAELVRLLTQNAFDVQVVMTEAARQFITPVTLQALSGKRVFSDLWDPTVENNMAHIELSRGAEAILIAPASADFIAKLAHGLTDDLLSTLCAARDCALWIAPAMNRQMWDNPANQRNIETLVRDGVHILGPAEGDQACGEVGMGRMLEAQQIFNEVQALSAPKSWAGVRVLVTAGPTVERIDAVRAITNFSSGRMGYAVAEAALEAGATVTLISGPTALSAPAQARTIPVTSAHEMFDAVTREIANADVFVSVAAVADYTVANPSSSKLKKSARNLSLELVPTADILGYVAQQPNAPFCVGFAAESDNLYEYAEAKRKRKGIPLLAANLVQNSMGGADGELVLFDDDGAHPLPAAAKIILARRLLEHALPLYRSRQKSAVTRIKKSART